MLISKQVKCHGTASRRYFDSKSYLDILYCELNGVGIQIHCGGTESGDNWASPAHG